MHLIRTLIVQALQALARAQLWHLARLQEPLYNAAMNLIAALLLGHVGLHHIKQWLANLLAKRSYGYAN